MNSGHEHNEYDTRRRRALQVNGDNVQVRAEISLIMRLSYKLFQWVRYIEFYFPTCTWGLVPYQVGTEVSTTTTVVLTSYRKSHDNNECDTKSNMFVFRFSEWFSNQSIKQNGKTVQDHQFTYMRNCPVFPFLKGALSGNQCWRVKNESFPLLACGVFEYHFGVSWVFTINRKSLSEAIGINCYYYNWCYSTLEW